MPFEKFGRIVIDMLDKAGNLYFRLGSVNYTKANSSLDEHTHEGMVEFVLMVKGNQIYRINDLEYHLKSGEISITLPNELHSTGQHPEDKSYIYYLIINLESDELSLGINKEETRKIAEEIYHTSKRVIRASSRIKEICDEIIQAYYSEKGYKKTMLRNLISSFVLDIADCISKQTVTPLRLDLQPVLEYISANINEEITISQLADRAGLSVSRLKARFREETGLPPGEYVLRQKIELAKILLKDSDNSIIDISCRLSFSSSQYFATVFKRFTTLTPSEFRNAD